MTQTTRGILKTQILFISPLTLNKVSLPDQLFNQLPARHLCLKSKETGYRGPHDLTRHCVISLSTFEKADFV